jgi:hypothetical protein
MGKMPDPPKPEKRPPPVTPESREVRQRGQRVLSEQQKKKGRLQTVFGGRFASMFGNRTGDV